MHSIKLKSILAAAAVAAFGATSAVAATTTYNVTSNVAEGAGAHSLWFANDGSSPARPLGSTGTRPNHFKFENRAPGFGTFEVDGTTAKLTGEVANSNGQSFFIEMFFVEFAYDGTNAGLKKISSGQSTADWKLYDLDRSRASTISYLAGTGDAALQSFDVSLRGGTAARPYKAQVGTGANDKDAGLFGLSTWITLTDKTGASGCGLAICQYAGDINVVLDLQPPGNNPPEVPLPAAGYMLLAGMGGMFAMRRRKRTA